MLSTENQSSAPADETDIAVEDTEALRVLLGAADETRRLIEREMQVKIALRGDQLTVRAADGASPDAAPRAAELLRQLMQVAKDSLGGGRALGLSDVRHMIAHTKNGGDVKRTKAVLSDTLVVSDKGKAIGPRTVGQKAYVESLRRADLVFAIGPAGTGKTYLAVAAAVAALKAKQVSRIILTRPAVEAGENLGFLPGDMEAKVDPYLRPLYDALFEMLDMEKAQKMFERRTIEVAPLAYMRGRTLSEAFIILDEAQNTTPAQMKMFLTRLGLGSKMIVTGDVTQTDLPRGQESGLRVASRVLTGVDNIEFVELGKADVVRHGIVQRIIEAYERDEAEQIRADGFVATRARRDENLL